MVSATWRETVIAQSENTIVIEGNHYFPREDVNMTFLKQTTHKTVCPWKGVAEYFDITVDDVKNENAAWSYQEPKTQEIAGYIAFWKGIEIEE